MEFILVRHAEPDAVEVKVGGADPGLTSRGKRQAEALAGCLGVGHLDLIVTSPARRALETAAPLAARRGLTPVTLLGLAEFDWGNVTEYVQAETLHANRDPQWLATAMTGEPGAGVDVPAFRARVIATFAELATANPGKRVLAVCHNGVLNAYMGDIVGMKPLLWVHTAYSSYSRVAAARDGRRGLVTLNETPHLLTLELRAPAP